MLVKFIHFKNDGGSVQGSAEVPNHAQDRKSWARAVKMALGWLGTPCQVSNVLTAAGPCIMLKSHAGLGVAFIQRGA